MLTRFRKDPVLYLSALGALISMLFVPPSGAYLHYLDYRVLALLLSLMLVVAGLQATGFFDSVVRRLLRRVHNTRSLAMVLVGSCFFASMLITNDVSLITFVPLTILLLQKAGQRKLLIPVIVLQTIAANLGSMLTPMGNPQNLYLHSLSGMSTGTFLKTMAPAVSLSLLLLLAAILLLIRPQEIQPSAEKTSCRGAWLWLLLFTLCLLSVLQIVPYGITLWVVLAAAALTNRSLLRQADYSLLLTFVFFFVFIGNLKQLPAVSQFFSSRLSGHELLAGVLLSQIISNVPAAMLLSGFTKNYAALLLGVNLGGLGTLIASMASLISYKLYIRTETARPASYLGVFTALNVIFLAILTAAVLLLQF